MKDYSYYDKNKVIEKLGGYFERLPNNPIIYPNMRGLTGKKGKNINGPCLIKVPDWVESPLGKYYLYFGNHMGTYIRLAYSDTVEGPYKIYKPGTLTRRQTKLKCTHIASPEIYIDNEKQEIVMYFHANVRGKGVYSNNGQMTYFAVSKDGIDFQPDQTQLTPFYLRVVRYNNYFYGVAKNDNDDGVLVRSKDGKSLFEKGPTFIKGFRHNALLLKKDKLWMFYSVAGDMPERILFTEFKLTQDWMSWKPSESITILEPETEWEGSEMEFQKSKYGGTKPMRALRDPAIYIENGEIYLLYSIKGEYGIAISRFVKKI